MERDSAVSNSTELQDLLVVEDNPGDVRLIKEAFDESQLETTLHTVSTGEDALDFVYQRDEYAAAPRPDVILVDWSLPQMNGGDVLREIKSTFPEILMVLMTGSEPIKDDIESETSQADAFLTKPTEPSVYLEIVRSLE